ncbi:MAG TPA: hypothetical protein VEA99_09120 [Gemmatimonadaceae bacterium]|nr:hypothetical protein [Gemmatimonadaceae bacterium]
MRKLSMMLSLAAVAAAAVPATAEAQWDIIRRTEQGRVITRGGDVYGDVYDRDRDRTSSRVPPGHMPPPGSCRVWIDGVPPGRQPRPTDCGTAERERHRYGANARVIYGDRTNGRRVDDRVYGRDSERRTRVYDRVINGRQCRVTETWQYGRRINTRTACDNNSSVYGRRVYDDRVYRRDDRWDDDSDGRKNKVKKVKVKHKNGKKGRD